MIAYSSVLFSALLDRHQAGRNVKVLEMLKEISPMA
jgi:hypothetical protein